VFRALGVEDSAEKEELKAIARTVLDLICRASVTITEYRRERTMTARDAYIGLLQLFQRVLSMEID
jgi:hypothetical protein